MLGDRSTKPVDPVALRVQPACTLRAILHPIKHFVFARYGKVGKRVLGSEQRQGCKSNSREEKGGWVKCPSRTRKRSLRMNYASPTTPSTSSSRPSNRCSGRSPTGSFRA